MNGWILWLPVALKTADRALVDIHALGDTTDTFIIKYNVDREFSSEATSYLEDTLGET
jgi:hypothetical protein